MNRTNNHRRLVVDSVDGGLTIAWRHMEGGAVDRISRQATRLYDWVQSLVVDLPGIEPEEPRILQSGGIYVAVDVDFGSGVYFRIAKRAVLGRLNDAVVVDGMFPRP